MSLGVFQNLNATDYFRQGKFTAVVAADISYPMPSFSGEFRAGTMFLNRLGIWQSNMTDGGGSRTGVKRWDPLLVDNTSAAVGRFFVPQWFHQGAYVPLTGEQRIFGNASWGTTFGWDVIDYNDPTNVIITDAFPNVATRGSSAASGVATTDVGWFEHPSISGSSEWIFFEGWDWDSSGNTLGTALITQATVRVVAGAGVSQAERPIGVTALVNLATGKATPLAGLPSLYQTNPDNDFQAGSLFGEAILFFDAIQFLPDSDSSRSAPKGQIFLSTNNGLNHYAIWVEWNPTGVSGTPLRTHLRNRLTTRFIIATTADTGTYPGIDSNIVAGTSSLNRLKVNPNNGRPMMHMGALSFNVVSYNADLYRQNMLEATPQAVVSQVTRPSARQQPATNRIVIVGTEAVGDLGERIGSVPVTWDLKRITTRGETLATTPTLGETVTVDQFPIDRNRSFPFDVFKDGTPMVEDDLVNGYTVNEALGQITFGSAEPVGGSVYTADYGHPTVPVAPPFGQLLVPEAVTDGNGEAFTRVRYLDEPLNAGFSDELTVTDDP